MLQDNFKKLKPLLKKTGLDQHVFKEWIYRDKALVLDFNYRGVKFSFDITPLADGRFALDIVERNHSSGFTVTTTPDKKAPLGESASLEEAWGRLHNRAIRLFSEVDLQFDIDQTPFEIASTPLDKTIGTENTTQLTNWDKVNDKPAYHQTQSVESPQVGLHDSIAEKKIKPVRKNKMKPLKAYWWRPKDKGRINIGDEINKHVIEYASGRQVERATVEHAEILAIGSVITDAKPNLKRNSQNPWHIWGSGSLEPKYIEEPAALRLHAVRGPLTDTLLKGARTNIYGDPGLLAPRIWKDPHRKKYSFGIIPHHRQIHDKTIKSLLNKTSNATMIDVTDPNIDETMMTITQCDFIVSTSLHGIILADAYEIPNVWLWNNLVQPGGKWKFFDYLLSVKRNTDAEVVVPDDFNLHSISKERFSTDHFSQVRHLADQIEKAFPSDLK